MSPRPGSAPRRRRAGRWLSRRPPPPRRVQHVRELRPGAVEVERGEHPVPGCLQRHGRDCAERGLAHQLLGVQRPARLQLGEVGHDRCLRLRRVEAAALAQRALELFGPPAVVVARRQGLPQHAHHGRQTGAVHAQHADRRPGQRGRRQGLLPHLRGDGGQEARRQPRAPALLVAAGGLARPPVAASRSCVPLLGLGAMSHTWLPPLCAGAPRGRRRSRCRPPILPRRPAAYAAFETETTYVPRPVSQIGALRGLSGETRGEGFDGQDPDRGRRLRRLLHGVAPGEAAAPGRGRGGRGRPPPVHDLPAVPARGGGRRRSRRGTRRCPCAGTCTAPPSCPAR